MIIIKITKIILIIITTTITIIINMHYKLYSKILNS
jgi:hypothetical protein